MTITNNTISPTDCGIHVLGSRASVDESAWDGDAAMSACASSDGPAACYGSICAGRKAGDPAKQSSHALPHHKSAGAPPNEAGVRSALGRLPQTQGLTNKAAAQAHLDAHMSAISSDNDEDDSKSAALNGNVRVQPPKENLVRGGRWPVEVRDSGAGPVLAGHFAVFDQWTEIDSAWEGHFMEKLSRGAFAKSFRENRQAMRVTFQHGKDPLLGDKPLGPIDMLEEDATGARYEVPLLDTDYNRNFIVPTISGRLMNGELRGSQLGASFRFRVVKDKMDKNPGESEFNPRGIPQRDVIEVDVAEFGPVTYPAYLGATAGMRSLTDDWILAQLAGDPDRLAQVLARHVTPSTQIGPPSEPHQASDSHTIISEQIISAPHSATEPPHGTPNSPSRTEVRKPMSQEEFLDRISSPHKEF